MKRCGVELSRLSFSAIRTDWWTHGGSKKLKLLKNIFYSKVCLNFRLSFYYCGKSIAIVVTVLKKVIFKDFFFNNHWGFIIFYNKVIDCNFIPIINISVIKLLICSLCFHKRTNQVNVSKILKEGKNILAQPQNEYFIASQNTAVPRIFRNSCAKMSQWDCTGVAWDAQCWRRKQERNSQVRGPCLNNAVIQTNLSFYQESTKCASCQQRIADSAVSPRALF